MPIDPSIPLSGRPAPAIVNPMEVMQGIQSMRAQREQTEALAEQRRALAEQTRLKTAEAQRAQAEELRLRSVYQKFGDKPVPLGTLANIVGPERAQKLYDGHVALQERQVKSYGEAQDRLARAIGAVEALPETLRPAVYDATVKHAVDNGWLKPEEVQPYSPEAVTFYQRRALTAKEQYDAAHPKPINGPAPGQSLLDPTTMKPVYTEAAKPEVKSFQSKDVLVNGKPAVANFDPHTGKYFDAAGTELQNVAPIPPRPPVNVNGGGGTDAKDIAAAIISGDQPPDLKALYRLGGPVRAELARQGYNLTNASLDWQATQKHVATLNGSKITTLMASVRTAKDSLGVIQELANKWQGGRFPILNKVNLLAAKNGAYGKEAASIATQLDGQITDVTSELGQVYMGGNSPTDHALKLAEKNLRGEWDQKVLTDMIKLADTNLTIRENSYKHSVPLGTGESNAYAQPPAGPAPVAAPAGMIRARDPQGNIHEAKAGTPLPAGWVKVGG